MPQYVPQAVIELLGWVEKSDIHMLIKSCVFHYEFELIHPFADGNGRIQRLFLAKLLKHIGYAIDFADFDADELMIATIKSVSGDVFMLRDLFRDKITK